MKSVGATLVLLAAACFATKLCKFDFGAYDFFKDNMAVTGDSLREGICSSVFQPFPVNVQHKGKCYLLLVKNGSISNAPNISVGYTDWCGNSNYFSVSSTQHFENLEYTFQADLKWTCGDNCESTGCSITASNKGITVQEYAEYAKNYNGQGIYTYPKRNYTIVSLAASTTNNGLWEISVSCPGSGRRLEKKIERVLNDVGLPQQRKILRETARSCLPQNLPKVEIADYFTKKCVRKC